MANISELRVGQGNVEVVGVIKEVGEKRSFNKFGRELSVVNAVLEDDSGSIKLTLWNDDANRFSEGDKIKVVNGYVNEFQGEKQLTSGKFGSIEKLGEEKDKVKKKDVKNKDEDDSGEEDESEDLESVDSDSF